MDFDDCLEIAGRVGKGIAEWAYLGIRKGAFKLQKPFVDDGIRKRFDTLVSLPLVELSSADNIIDTDLDPNYFTPEKVFRPGCGKCEAEVLGRTLILTSIKNGKWHAVPWPVLALAHHGGGSENLWSWMASSLSWSRTKQNVENLATVSRVKQSEETYEILNFDGQEWRGVSYELNGLHHYMPIGIDVLIDAKLVTVVRDSNGVDLIVPTTELLRRAKSSAELNNR
ncbi:MAG: hypothetical protein HY226_04045 [Candidatus Vogelbacteria bacterium]|nr:hypothetical protein [Candidatus Vogelbacteria bacterium]